MLLTLDSNGNLAQEKETLITQKIHTSEVCGQCGSSLIKYIVLLKKGELAFDHKASTMTSCHLGYLQILRREEEQKESRALLFGGVVGENTQRARWTQA